MEWLMEIIKACEKPSKVDWKNGMSATDKDYICPKIVFAVKGDDLYIKLQRYDRKAFYAVIEGYKNYTAVQVLSATTFGRHYEALLFKFWKQNGLRLGITEGLLRDV